MKIKSIEEAQEYMIKEGVPIEVVEKLNQAIFEDKFPVDVDNIQKKKKE